MFYEFGEYMGLHKVEISKNIVAIRPVFRMLLLVAQREAVAAGVGGA